MSARNLGNLLNTKQSCSCCLLATLIVFTGCFTPNELDVATTNIQSSSSLEQMSGVGTPENDMGTGDDAFDGYDPDDRATLIPVPSFGSGYLRYVAGDEQFDQYRFFVRAGDELSVTFTPSRRTTKIDLFIYRADRQRIIRLDNIVDTKHMRFNVSEDGFHYIVIDADKKGDEEGGDYQLDIQYAQENDMNTGRDAFNGFLPNTEATRLEPPISGTGAISYGPGVGQYDQYQIAMKQGDKVTIELTGDAAAPGLDLFVFNRKTDGQVRLVRAAKDIGARRVQFDIITTKDDTLYLTLNADREDAQIQYQLSIIPTDSDGDGLTDTEETALGSNPRDRDSDDDTLTDFDEVTIHHTDPTSSDSDGDGLRDDFEISTGTDPNKDEQMLRIVVERSVVFVANYDSVEVVARVEDKFGVGIGGVPLLFTPSGGNPTNSIVVTDSTGQATWNYESANGPVIKDITIAPATPDWERFKPEHVVIVQNYIDNFNVDLNATGVWAPIGDSVQIEIQENDGNGHHPDPVTGNDSALVFGRSSGVFDTIIGVEKRFLDGEGNPSHIDLSRVNSISYWARSLFPDNPDAGELRLEIVVGDGGNRDPSSPAMATGSTWAQTQPGCDFCSFKRFVEYRAWLEGTVGGVDGGFIRVAEPSDSSQHQHLAPLLDQVTTIRFVISRPNNIQVPIQIELDDISVENRRRLTVDQQRVLVPGGLGVDTKLYARVEDALGGIPELNVQYSLTRRSINPNVRPPLPFPLPTSSESPTILSSARTDATGVSMYTFPSTNHQTVFCVTVSIIDERNLDEEVCVLQEQIEDFSHGQQAGGDLTAFGPALGKFSAGGNPDNPLLNLSQLFKTPATLSTDGFRPDATFLGIVKTFVSSQEARTNPDRASNSIDARGFGAIRYKVASDLDASDSMAEIAIEIQIGDGGITGNPSLGSTWSQHERVRLSDLPVYSLGDSSTLTTVTVDLVGTIEGVAGGFHRTLPAVDTGGEANLQSLLANVTAVRIVVFSSGDELLPAQTRTLRIADIQLDREQQTIENDFDTAIGQGAGIVVMTRRMHRGLGSDSSQKNGQAIWDGIQDSILHESVQEITEEIATATPDLIGLQKVLQVHSQPRDGSAGKLEADFLRLLLDALVARGLQYQVVTELPQSDIEISVETISGGNIDLRLTDRNVILAHQNVDASPLAPVTYLEDFVSPSTWELGFVQARIKDTDLRFLNVHVTPKDSDMREQQMRRLEEMYGSDRDFPLIVVGNFSTDTPREDFDSRLQSDYRMLLNRGFVDTWMNSDLESNVRWFRRTNLILFRSSDAMEVVGQVTTGPGVPSDITLSGVWSSVDTGAVAGLNGPPNALPDLVARRVTRNIDDKEYSLIVCNDGNDVAANFEVSWSDDQQWEASDHVDRLEAQDCITLTKPVPGECAYNTTIEIMLDSGTDVREQSEDNLITKYFPSQEQGRYIYSHEILVENSPSSSPASCAAKRKWDTRTCGADGWSQWSQWHSHLIYKFPTCKVVPRPLPECIKNPRAWWCP